MSTVESAPTTIGTFPEVRPDGFWDGVARSYIPGATLDIDASLTLHGRVADDVDPVTREVIRYALLNTNLEHSALIQRLCVSPVTMLTRDFQTSVLTETGDLLCLGPNLQYFSTAHEMSVKWTLENRSGNPGIRPGDVFLANDPYVGAPHQPDTNVFAPLFVGGELFCWLANSMHLADVGGSVQGSFCITAADAWGDPPNFPPVRLVEEGRLRDDIENLFVRQSRLPLAVKMDLRAAISAVSVTGERVAALVERYGAETVKAVMHGMLDAGAEVMAARLATIPDGRFSHRAYTEAAVPGDREVYGYQVNITKQGDRLIVDNLGTDPQAGSINVTYAAFAGAVRAAIVANLASDTSGAYGGAHRCIDVRPEPGLLSCADHPAAVSPSGAFTTMMQLNCAAIAMAKMLACSTDPTVRARALGANLPHFYGAIGGGLDPEGNLFILVNTNGMMGALGGTPVTDGVDSGGHYWIPEGIAYNVEELEDQYPVLYLYRRLLPVGADGAGRMRGGLGFEEAAICHGSPFLQMALYTNESFPKGQGQLGANPGSRAHFRLRAGTDVAARLAAGEVPQDMDALSGEELPVGFKAAPLDLIPGHVWEWSSPTAAGYGDPLLRDPAAALRDVAAGLLEPDTARRVHGIVITGAGEDAAVDADATAAERLAQRSARLGRAAAEAPEAPQGARRIGDLLHVVDGRWWCGGADLGPVDGPWKAGAQCVESPIEDVAPEFATPDPEMAGKMVARAWLCPVTGHRIDLELSRRGDAPLDDMLLAGAGA
jgi:N-methylhydantoinase B